MEMRGPGRNRFVLALALPLFAAIPLAAQTLNPVVTVLPRPAKTVPDGCEQGLTETPGPRVTPEEKKAAVAPAPEVPLPPPSTTLRGTLRQVQEAAERNDKEGFTNAVGRAASIVEDYPTGGEKTAAAAALKVYNDILAFWNYQYEVPTGAFFDATSRDLFARLKSYPDYERFISDKTIVDSSGTRFYPTRETRDFLVREASARLRRMSGGAVPVPTPAPQPPRVTTKTPAPPTQTPHAKKPVEHKTTTATTKAPTKKTTTTAHKAKPAPAPKTTAHKAPKKHEPVKVAEAPKKVTVTEKPAPKPAPSPAPAPVTTATTAPTKPPSPPPAPHPTETVPSTTTMTPTQTTATTDTATATSATETTDTTATTATAETGTQPTQASPAGSRRNLILPIILIVLGVGVLILLFRTSS